jgi:acyl carrier protein
MDKQLFYRKLDEMLELPEGIIHGPQQLADTAAWDSLAVISFIALADNQNHTSVPARLVSDCRTVDDLAALIGEKPQA